MSLVKVNCPKCQAGNELEKSLLEWTQGQAVCASCGHQFQMIKKLKSAQEKKQVVDEKNASELTFRQPIEDILDKPVSDKVEIAPQVQKKATGSLKYRIPKAQNKARFVAVEDSPFAFNLMDRESVNAQLPQLAIKPAVSAAASKNESQNNITIHTDSLVFTLVSDNGMNPLNHLPQSQIATALPSLASVAAVQPVVVANNDNNWTIATIAALAVLIIQLFSLILMLI